MLILASTIASQALGEYKIMVDAALNVGLTPVVIKEILYQSVPYVGVAKVFDFLHATNEVLQKAASSLPLAGQSTTTPETRFEKGVAAQKAIFGEAIDKMRQQAPKDQLHIQDFLAANCFGDYYTRNGIDLKTRELLTFAMLISLGGCEPQVKGHVTGNLKVGNDRDALDRCRHPTIALHRISPHSQRAAGDRRSCPTHEHSQCRKHRALTIETTIGKHIMKQRTFFITGVSSGFGRQLRGADCSRGFDGLPAWRVNQRTVRSRKPQ